MEQEFLTPDDLVARYKGKISKRTLANWRSHGEGPTPTKIGGRVMYLLKEVLKWEEQRTRLANVTRAATWFIPYVVACG